MIVILSGSCIGWGGPHPNSGQPYKLGSSRVSGRSQRSGDGA